jgi:hypothetical protein
MSLLGWKIEWSSPFRTNQGVVIAERGNGTEVRVKSFDFDEIYDLSLPQTRIAKIKPDFRGYIRHQIEVDIDRKADWSQLQCEELIQHTLSHAFATSAVASDRPMKLEIQQYAGNSSKVKELAKYCLELIRRHTITSDESPDKSNRNGDGSAGVSKRSASSRKDKPILSDDDEDGSDEEDGDDDDSADSSEESDNDDEDDFSDDDDDEDEDNDEDENSEEDEDEQDESESEPGTPARRRRDKSDRAKLKPASLRSSNSSKVTPTPPPPSTADSNKDIEPIVIINLKITILPDDVVRGFSVALASGYQDIVATFVSDYMATPTIHYVDPEGDKVSILAQSDFLYAVRTHQHLHSPSIDVKSSSPAPFAPTPPTLRLTAEFRQSKPAGGINDNTSLNNESDVKRRGSGSSASGMKQSSIAAVDIKHILSEDDLHMNPLLLSTTHQSSILTYEQPSPLKSPQSRPRTYGSMVWQRGEVIGSGSFGQVFAGIDLSTGKRIAVKEVP